MTSEDKILAECRKLGEVFKREIAQVHSELDGLAAMLKHGFDDVTASKEDAARVEAEIAALKRLIQSLSA
jgi:hypothetical protein